MNRKNFFHRILSFSFMPRPFSNILLENPIQNKNVKDFGARGDGKSDDTQAFIKACESINRKEISSLYIPSGNYIIDEDSIIIKSSCKIFGDGNNSILTCKRKNQLNLINNNACIKIECESCIIEDISIKSFNIGISINKVSQNNVFRCHIQQNQIGLLIHKGYMNSILNSYIKFNKIGILCKDEAYQVIIENNIIDNNITKDEGGIGILLSGNNGCEIVKNTIEGNRNINSGLGIGILILGVCSKLNIASNWFETNYDLNNKFSVDILIGSETNKNIINNLLPPTLQNIWKQGCYGSLYIRNNIFLYTPNSIRINHFSYGYIFILNNIFTGKEEFENRPISIIHKSLSYYNTTIKIEENFIQNTQGNVANIDRKMHSGYNKSYIFIDESIKIKGKLIIKNEYFSDFL